MTAAVDVCYPVTKGAERKDRFVANLTADRRFDLSCLLRFD